MIPVGIAESACYIADRPDGARGDTDRCLRHLPDRLTPYLAPMLPHTDRARAASRTGGSSTSESRAQRCAAGVRDDLGSRTGAWRGVSFLYWTLPLIGWLRTSRSCHLTRSPPASAPDVRPAAALGLRTADLPVVLGSAALPRPFLTREQQFQQIVANMNLARGRGRHNACARHHSPAGGNREGAGQLFAGNRALFTHLLAHYCSPGCHYCSRPGSGGGESG